MKVKADVCRCGHMKFVHSHKDSRGRCNGTITYLFGRVPADFPLPATTKKLDHRKKKDIAIWEKILSEYKPTLKKRVMQRGYAYADCPCPMFHLVDLGQIKLVAPK